LRREFCVSAPTPPKNKEKSSESDEKALEVSDATVLSVHTGKRFLRLSERSEDVD
jgi:hypothetical protein